VDAWCRFSMMKWCNEVVDVLEYSRETAAIAMSCLDRFMATPAGREILWDRSQFQLAAMTALYSSVKIHEQKVMDAKLVSTMSHNSHSPEDIEAMEFRMLTALDWRVHPPTAISFIRNMVQLLPKHLIDDVERNIIMELAIFQLGLLEATSENHPEFMFAPPSVLAFGSLLNAVDSIVSDGFGFKVAFASFEAMMSCLIRVDYHCLRCLRIAFYEIVDVHSKTNNVREDNDDEDDDEDMMDVLGLEYLPDDEQFDEQQQQRKTTTSSTMTGPTPMDVYVVTPTHHHQDNICHSPLCVRA